MFLFFFVILKKGMPVPDWHGWHRLALLPTSTDTCSPSASDWRLHEIHSVISMFLYHACMCMFLSGVACVRIVLLCVYKWQLNYIATRNSVTIPVCNHLSLLGRGNWSLLLRLPGGFDLLKTGFGYLFRL